MDPRRYAYHRTGAGRHGKSRKAERRRQRQHDQKRRADDGE